MKKFILILIALFLSFSCVFAAESLSDRQKSIVLISSYTATGDLINLEKALNQGLDNGLTVNEIKEILVQVYAYAGFPRSLNGISTFADVLDTRKAKGVNDVEGENAKPLNPEINKKEYGNNVQIELIGKPTNGRYIEFTPAIDTFLKEHLFADIFGRGVLTYQDREIETVAILSSIKGLEPQLKGHIQIALHIGVTADEIKEILTLTKSKSGLKILKELTGNECDTAALSNDEIVVLKDDTFRTIDVNKINFSGNAKMAAFLPKENPLNITSGIVYFEKNSRTNWHSHPNGQLIIIKSGHGQVQQEGGKVVDIYQDDVIWFPPNVKHWQGAASDSEMSHYAFSRADENGKSADWYEKVEK